MLTQIKNGFMCLCISVYLVFSSTFTGNHTHGEMGWCRFFLACAGIFIMTIIGFGAFFWFMLEVVVPRLS